MKKEFAGYLGILLSFIGSIAAFFIFLEKFLSVQEEKNAMINEMMLNAGVKQEKFAVFLFVTSIIGVIVFWIMGFLTYKIIFAIAHVKIKEINLLLALGSGYIISFIIGCFIIKYFSFIIVTMITNIIGCIIIYFSLFEQIKEKLRICLPLSCFLIIINIVLTIV